MLHFFHSILFYHIRHKVDKIGKILKNMPAVKKDQNSRAKGHDQKPSFFFIDFRIIIQTYSFFNA